MLAITIKQQQIDTWRNNESNTKNVNVNHKTIIMSQLKYTIMNYKTNIYI